MAACRTSRTAITTAATTSTESSQTTTATHHSTLLELSDTIFYFTPTPCTDTSSVKDGFAIVSNPAAVPVASPTGHTARAIIRHAKLTATTAAADTSLTLRDLYRTDTAAAVTLYEYPSIPYTPLHVKVIALIILILGALIVLDIVFGKKVS